VKKKFVLILTIIAFIIAKTNLHAQTDFELWTKLSPEIRLNIQDMPLEIRWRPVDYIFLPQKYIGQNGLGRTDLMVGVNIWKFKLFNYTKYDEFENLWTGARLDLNLAIFNKKLLINIQERYFWGLNENSSEHYYLIQYIRYRIGKRLTTGVLSYGKWRPERDFNKGNWFVGPSVNFKISRSLNLHAAFTKDVFHEPIYMVYIRLGYRIYWRRVKHDLQKFIKELDEDDLDDDFFEDK